MSLPGDVPVPPQRPLSPQTKLNEDFTVKAEGTGKGTMTVVTVYNAKVPDKENKCDSFDLRLQVEDVKTGESPTFPPPPPCPPYVPSMEPHVPFDVTHVPSLSPCTPTGKEQDGVFRSIKITICTR